MKVSISPEANLTLWIKWITTKMETLFKLKRKCLHPACKIYYDVFCCSETYIGGTVRNVKIRRNEHNMPPEKSNPSKHLNDNLTHHHFNWSVNCNAPVKKFTRKILEVDFITLLQLNLNDQIESETLYFNFVYSNFSSVIIYLRF